VRKHLKEFANAYSINENDLKHEVSLAKKMLQKESQLPTSGVQEPECRSVIRPEF